MWTMSVDAAEYGPVQKNSHPQYTGVTLSSADYC